MSTTTIQIIVGTVMGRASKVAEQLQLHLSTSHSVRINNQFNAGDIRPNEILLICTSNTGVGDLPANIKPFYSHLLNDAPAIAGLGYGIINLGDSSYPGFAQAGEKLDSALANTGGIRIGEPLILDANLNEDQEKRVGDWLAEWVKLL
jgi:MioC protein